MHEAPVRPTEGATHPHPSKPTHPAIRVGFIGLGDQGEPMARRLAQSSRCELVVFARQPRQAQRVLADGGRWVASIEELARSSDVLSICVSDDAAVREVVGGALPALAAGTVILVHSTVSADTCRELGGDARGLGVEVVDAPVSGGAQRARDGRLTVFVGGEPDAVEQARPAMTPFADAIFHVGPLGAGQTLKLVNNYLFATHREIARQATAVVAALGLDVCAATAAIAVSTGASECIRRVAEAGDDRGLAQHSGGRARGQALLSKDIQLFRQQVSDCTGFSAYIDELVDAGLRWAGGESAPPNAATTQLLPVSRTATHPT